MIWLQDPPWIRWGLAILIALMAVWTEFRPDPLVEHPFAVRAIAVGEPIDDAVEIRSIPSGMLEPTRGSGYATRSYSPGEPLTPAGVSAEPISADPGWWSVEIDVPAGASIGDEVRLVLVDSGETVSGRVVATNGEDPLAMGGGAVAVPPDDAAAVAVAVAAGRVVVLVATG